MFWLGYKMISSYHYRNLFHVQMIFWSFFFFRGVPIPIPVSKTSQLAQLALTDITYLKSNFLCHSKTAIRKLGCDASGNYCFKSNEDERREPTELAKYLHSAKFYTGKSKEMCKEVILWAGIGLVLSIGRSTSLGVWISIGKEKIVSEHL